MTISTAISRRIFPVLLGLALLAPRPAAGDGQARARAIFLRYYEAMGGLARMRRERTGYAEGTLVMDGMAGTFRLWQGRVLRYRRAEDFGVIHQVFGDIGQFAWQVDTNGKRQVIQDPEALKRRRIQALLDDFAHLKTSADPFSLAYGGIEKVAGAHCHVVTLSNRINSDVTVYYFRSTDDFLIRTVSIRPDYRVETDFSDFRRVHGLLRPFRQESRVLPRDKTEIIQIRRYRADPAVDPWIFAPPPGDAADAVFDNGVSAEGVAFQFIDNAIFVPVTMAGRTSPWVLDSGASMSLVDAGAAGAMGRVPAGRVRGFGSAGGFDLQFVRLPAFRVGGVRMASQTAFAYAGLTDRFDVHGVTGILGFDFLSRFVVRIDYAGRRLSLYAPERFIYKGSGRVMEAPLKDRMFIVPITVDGRYKGQWSLDLGAFDLSFHFPFAKRHGFLDRPGVDRLSAGMGTEFRERTVAFDTVELGGLTVQRPLIGIPYRQGRGIHAGGELAGNAGNRLLRRFVIYLDYARQQVIVEKGGDFNRRFPRDQSGMQVTAAPDALARVVFVASGTPAASAGFRAGDRVMAVDAVPGPPPATAADLARLLCGPTGTRLGFTVQRGGIRLRLALELADLFAGSSKQGDVGS